jgi:hypothetical protein
MAHFAMESADAISHRLGYVERARSVG